MVLIVRLVAANEYIDCVHAAWGNQPWSVVVLRTRTWGIFHKTINLSITDLYDHMSYHNMVAVVRCCLQTQKRDIFGDK